jgi:hypothetical protein
MKQRPKKKKKIERSKKQKSGSLKIIKNIDRPLANLTKMRNEKT